ncbi:hypothetical protein [Streptomyces sp. gb1(2016)]|nr:hypothetical protein [Streptomyces sp. gb1(2016)]
MDAPPPLSMVPVQVPRNPEGTVLPDGTLRRQITSTGQSLTYTKTG